MLNCLSILYNYLCTTLREPYEPPLVDPFSYFFRNSNSNTKVYFSKTLVFIHTFFLQFVDFKIRSSGVKISKTAEFMNSYKIKCFGS